MQTNTQNDVEHAVTIALLQQKLIHLEEELETVKDTQAGIQNDMGQALRWGLITLGGAVISMALWIFAHLKQLITA
jgi:hypothetical protein